MQVSGTDGVECSRKVAIGRRVASAIKSLVNARDCSLNVLEYVWKRQYYGKRRRDLELWL